jgi:hypothetical protein
MLFHCLHLILYPAAYDVHTTVRRLLLLIDYHNMLNGFLQWKHMCYNLFRPQHCLVTHQV